MQRWFFSPRRHVPRGSRGDARRVLGARRLERAAAQRRAVPRGRAGSTSRRRVRRELGSHRRQGRHLPALRPLRRPERGDGGRPRRYHGIDPDRVVVTGWPQTDVFHRGGRADYDALLARSYGLDPAARSSSSWGTRRRTRPTRALRRAARRRGGRSARERFQLLFRPHPRDREWRERFARPRGRRRRLPPGAELHRPRGARRSAPARRRGRRERRDDPPRRARQRPAGGLRPLRRGRSAGESWAAKNVVGEHYEELAASGAFYRAESFEEVVAGIERALADPDELAEARRRVVREVVGEVDGRAAERVVDAIVEVVGSD